MAFRKGPVLGAPALELVSEAHRGSRRWGDTREGTVRKDCDPVCGMRGTGEEGNGGQGADRWKRFDTREADKKGYGNPMGGGKWQSKILRLCGRKKQQRWSSVAKPGGKGGKTVTANSARTKIQGFLLFKNVGVVKAWAEACMHYLTKHRASASHP